MLIIPRALLVACGLWSALAPQQPPFVERVDVARVLIDARAFDESGRPLAGLEAADFAVRIGGARVRVESAEWVGGQAAMPSELPASTAAQAPPHGRLVVILVQRSLEPHRIVGLMELGRLIDGLLQPLGAGDRVAVLSFDSRLRFWTDFTGDLARVKSILSREVINARPDPPIASAGVSLMARLGPDRAGRIYGIEHALRQIGEALEPLPGAKSLVLLGYGFGRFDGRSGQVLLMDGYGEASAALQRARVSVFALNVTRADYNSLQAGLQTVAAETGGTYASTYHFPALAVDRVARALAGYYVLFVETPDVRAGAHRIEVRLTRRRGTVTARTTYVAAGV